MIGDRVLELAYKGNWPELLAELRRYPDLVNASSHNKAYTALHQAAWHGASPEVVGELLQLGADRSLRTHGKDQTAQDVARDKHPGQADLQYLLAPGARSLAQLVRKVASEARFTEGYDGNRVICDRLVSALAPVAFPATEAKAQERVIAALIAVMGADVRLDVPPRQADLKFGSPDFEFNPDVQFWRGEFLPSPLGTAGPLPHGAARGALDDGIGPVRAGAGAVGSPRRPLPVDGNGAGVVPRPPPRGTGQACGRHLSDLRRAHRSAPDP